MPVCNREEINGYLEAVRIGACSQKMKLHNILLRPQTNIWRFGSNLPGSWTPLGPYEQEMIDMAEIAIK